MQFGRKKTLMDRAQEVADQVTEAVMPRLEAAVVQTREKAGPALTDARDRARPLVAESAALAAEKAAVGAALAAEKAQVGAALAAERAQLGAAAAAERAAVGRQLAAAKVAEIRRQPQPEPKSGGKLKLLLLLSGLLALGGVVFSKLRSKKGDNWQSSYVPTPPPSQSEGTVSTATPTQDSEDLAPSTAMGGDPLTDPLVSTTDDIGGGAPGEAMSDAVEEPVQPSTPEAPAEVIDIDDVQHRDR